MTKIIISIVLTSFLFVSCNSNDNNNSSSNSNTLKDEIGDFPELKNISEYPETSFSPCLESKFASNKNCVYAASLLFAWDEIKNEINEPLSKFSSTELLTMYNSETYKGVLSKDEYYSEAKIMGQTISASASFSKSLPFISPLTKYYYKRFCVKFTDKPVETFGFDGYSEFAKVKYYNDSNDFALVLIPEDTENEIILIKSNFNDTIDFVEELNRFNDKISAYHGNKTEANSWKYGFNDEDEVKIPIIGFNIEANYSDIEESSFNSTSTEYIVTKAHQRNAFILNENGAKIETEAEMTVEEACMPPEEAPLFKLMYFNQAYIIFLKKKSSKYPYFAVYITNTELMTEMGEMGE